MFNSAIVRSVYAKEFREFLQDTRTLIIVFLIPLLFVPAVTLITYSTSMGVENKPSAIAVLHNDCSQLPNDIAGQVQCFGPEARTTIQDNLRDGHLDAMLDMSSGTLLLANAALTAEPLQQKMEQFYLRSTYAPTPPLQIEDLQSDTSVVNIIGTSLANIIVMLIIVFSFVGALNFGMDITVGEKERGSFRLYSEFKDKIQSIFAGKLVFTSFCAALTAALGIVGILLSSVAVDTVYGSAASTSASDIDKMSAFFQYLDMLNTADIIVVFCYLIPSIFLISALTNLLGCIAKNMKEAKLLGVLLMMALMALSKIHLGDDMFFFTAFIPVLNVFSGVNMALALEVDYAHLLVATLVNIAICMNTLFDIKKLILKEIV